jgi:predicted acyltransferase
VDLFRGLTIILMVLVNYLAGVRVVPAWLRHAPGAGLTFVDVIAPAFLVAIGLTYGSSYSRRLDQDGRSAALGHFVRRWFALIGIGAIIAAGTGITGAEGRIVDWGVLQAIGTAGLLTLPLLRRPAWVRGCVGLILLAVYQAGFVLFFSRHVFSSSHGGMWGSLAWSATLILSTVFGDMLGAGQERRAPAARRAGRFRAGFISGLALSLAYVALGMLLTPVVPIRKAAVSPSYVLVCTGLGGGAFWVIYQLERWSGLKPRLLLWWGRNPLLLYVLHYFLLAVLVLPGVDWWYAGAQPWLVVTQAGVILGILTGVAWRLARHKIILSM